MLHKHPKTGVYYFRKRIPKELVSVIGKREFKKSLNTKNRKEAEKLVVAIEHEFNQMLERERQSGLIPLKEREYALSRLKVYGLASKEGKLDLSYIQFCIKVASEIYCQSQQKLNEELGKGRSAFENSSVDRDHALSNLHHSRKVLAELLLFERMFSNPAISPSSYNLDKARSERVEALIVELDLFNGSNSSLFASPPLNLNLPARSTERMKLSFEDVLEEWKLKVKPRARSVMDWETAIRRFTELHGKLNIEDVQKNHIREFRDALVCVPKNLTKKYKNISFDRLYSKFSGLVSVTQKIEYVSEKTEQLSKFIDSAI